MDNDAIAGIAIVTGASRGIGAAVANAAARSGYGVVVNYSLDAEGADAVVKDIQAQGGKALAVQRVMDVNVAGMIFMCQEAVRRLSTENGGPGGSIINISSTATKAGSPGTWVHYAASKGAVDVLTVGLAAEVAKQGIRVNAVAPGSTNTGLHAAAGMPDRVERLNPTIPMGRGAEPEEVAAAVMWLMSGEAGYITGAVLPVSGGR